MIGLGSIQARATAGAALVLALAASAAAGDVVAVRAGTVHRVSGEVLEGGATVLIEDGKILAVGRTGEVTVPPGARTVDYGADAVIVPGLVAADSRYGSSLASERTADPGVRALDNFDPYTTLYGAVTSGVTTLYMAPARGRLIAGQGAVVKSAGDVDGRVLAAGGTLHGSISSEARRTPGYWEPPVPATVDVGLGVERPQLPRTTMGAIQALDELFRLAGGESALADEYGQVVGLDLAAALKSGARWRMGAESAGEVRALLEFFAAKKLPLVIDGAGGAKALAKELAAAGVTVVARPAYLGGRDAGKTLDAEWPEDGVVAALAAAGVRLAVVAPPTAGSDDLFFAAALAMRGGLDRDAALRAITLGAAEALGVAGRVGSLDKGKDADLVVLSGAPLASGSVPVATWIDGDEAWNAARDAQRYAVYRAERAGLDASTARVVPATVISVQELHLGDGHVLTPGEVLMRDGKILEVGTRVGRPAGTVVVSGVAAMPGMIDALGHLGLEGSNRPFSSRSDNTRILAPGDRVDRMVAQRGVTTVHLGSRNISGATTPTVAYKPAASTFGGLVVDASAAVRMKWSEDIVAESGNTVRATLAKALDYKQKWDKYIADMAEWKPPVEGDAAEEEQASEETGSADTEKDAADESKSSDEKKDKKKKGEREAARAVTGVFEGHSNSEDGGEQPVRFQLLEHADGTIEGFVRTVHHPDVLPITGRRDGYDVTLQAESPERTYDLKLAQHFSNDPSDEKKPKKPAKDDEEKKPDEAKGGAAQEPEGNGEKKDEPKKDEPKKDDKEAPVVMSLRGEVTFAGQSLGTVDVAQTSTEYKVARRPELVRQKDDKPATPKGQPKEPSADPDLEILRRAMEGHAAVLVEVERADQILACVDAFAAVGLKPVLVGADGAEALAGQLRGRIAGVLPSRNMTRNLSATRSVNRFAELAAAGLPIAFYSGAEEGAAELGTFALRAVVDGLSPRAALIALTSGAAQMLGLQAHVGALEAGLDADVLLLDGSPYELSSTVQRVWVNGEEIR